MPIIAPTPALPLPVPPSTSDILNFDPRGDAFNAHLQAHTQPEFNALAANAYNNALEAEANAIAAAVNAANAVAAAGVIKWVTGTNYAQGLNVWSPTSFLTYRHKVAAVSGIDPASDPATWQVLSPLLNVIHEPTTARNAGSSEDIWLENPLASVVTANPTPADLEEFAVTPANGKLTNSINFGAAVVQGPVGLMTGVLTLNLGTRMRFRYSTTLVKWITL